MSFKGRFQDANDERKVNRMKKILKAILPAVIVRRLRSALYAPKMLALRVFWYDLRRFFKYAGVFNPKNRQSLLAQIIMEYHVLEKGLTMPRRHLGFGHDVVMGLMGSINDFSRLFGTGDPQVRHAIGCVKAYYDLHVRSGFDMTQQREYWGGVKMFCEQHRNIPDSEQRELSSAEFYSSNESAFPAFAHSRHTSRYYEGSVDIKKITDSVSLAMTAPSACNRQYVRVCCVSDHSVRDDILKLQNGNRGFGGDADKLLVVVADLMGIRWPYERNDVYTNAGIFIMNLSYALHYNRVAHCILNWSVDPATDIRLRELLKINESETVVSFISCGNAPEKLMIASSPRKDLKDVFTEIA